LKSGAGVADAGAAADQPGTNFGVALQADVSTTLTAAMLKGNM
jgi:hypothetical protein